MKASRLRSWSASLLALCVCLAPLAARAETDACTLITSEQVTASVHVPVGAGSHVTPSFVKTCTWTPTTPSNVRAVTVNLQTAAFYDGAKNVALRTAAMAPGARLVSVGVGQDGFYEVQGGIAMLFFKQGSVSVKVAVYAKAAVDQIETMELEIAKHVAAKL